MHGPYRQSAAVLDAEPAGDARDPEALVIHGLLGLVGGSRLAVVWALDESFGAEATVALVFVVLGMIGLLGYLLRR